MSKDGVNSITAKSVVKPKLAIVDGRVTTTSLAVAEHLGKDHWDVLTAIRNLECSQEFHSSNFMLGDCLDGHGKAMPLFRMTRDGFSMLAIVFTGRRSKAVKKAYLQAFDMLETAVGISSQFGGVASEHTAAVPTLPNAVPSPTVGDVFQFEDTRFEIVDCDGRPWLRGQQIADALGYKNPRQAIDDLYSRNADEFTEDMTSLVKLPTAGGLQEVRIFSPRGCHLLALFARTDKAKAFRRWVLDVLEGKAPSPTPSLRGRQPSNEEVFLRLFYAFDQNVGDATLLWVLMQLGATSQWIAPSLREIAEASAGRISKSNVPRCAVKLKQRGLIDMRADLPWARIAYFVSEEAVMKLLQEASRQLAGLPGIQAEDDSPLLLGMGVKTLH